MTISPIVLVAAVFGVVFSEALGNAKGRGFLFAVAAVVAVIGMFQVVDRRRSTFVIASYLRCVIEPHMTHVKWETRLRLFRHRARRKSGYGATLSYELVVYSVLIATSLVLGILFSWFDNLGKQYFIIFMLFWLILCVSSLWFACRAWINGRECTIGSAKLYDKDWETVEEEMNKA